MQKKTLFTISQFAKMSNCNRKKLIYYDRIDLFKPSYIGDNGYRYYEHSQLELFFTITTLSTLGMPIKDIKEYLSNKNPDNAIKILRQLKESADKEILKLSGCTNLIQQRIENIKTSHQAKLYQPYIKYFKKSYIFSSSSFSYNTNSIPAKVYIKLWTEAEKKGISYGYPTNYLISEQNIRNNNFLTISNVFIKLEEEDKNKANNFFPEGLYAVVYGEGHYGDIDALYRQLYSFISDNNYNIIGPAKEEYLIDEVISKNNYSFLIKVSIHVGMKLSE